MRMLGYIIPVVLLGLAGCDRGVSSSSRAGNDAEAVGARQSSDASARAGATTQPDRRVFGTWVADDVPTDWGDVRIKLKLREEGPLTLLAWSELPLVGKVRDKEAPFTVRDNTIHSDAIRDGTTVQYRFDGDDLIIEYADGKTVRFRRAE